MNSTYPLHKKSITNAKAAKQFIHAVSHPTRETILAIIHASSYCTTDYIVERLKAQGIKMLQPNVSKFISVLYDANVVDFIPNTENRRQSLYFINMEHLTKGLKMFEYFTEPVKK